MHTVYLNPSNNENIHYFNGGNESYYMNLIVDEMIPYLKSSGINYIKNYNNHKLNKPTDLNIIIKSKNESKSKSERGIDVFYIGANPFSFMASSIIYKNLKEIYPQQEKVNLKKIDNKNNLKNHKLNTVILSLCNPKNVDDSTWVKENIPYISENISICIAEFFAVPLVTPQPSKIVAMQLNNILYERPSTKSDIILKIPKGTKILQLGKWENWYISKLNNKIGYIKSSN